MKLLTINRGDKQILGVKSKRGVIDVEKALAVQPNDSISTNIMDVIEGGEAAIANLDNYIKELKEDQSYIVDEDQIDWGPAITKPNKIICVGLNYKKHADETNSPYPETPILFTKYNNTLTGHKKDIAVPIVTEKLDYEVELGIVIGKKAKDVSREEALEYVFGYTTVNDLSARDLQFASSQWLLGKSCDDFSPVGPYIVTSDEVGDPNDLQLKTIVNGEVRQNSNTADMIFPCDEIVSYISKHMTLTPGDIILTGTPEGVAMGFENADEKYLKPGDVVTVEVEKLGSLTNTFVEEK